MSNIPINLSGTLAADPQSRTLPTGRACASFRLAVNHWHLNRETGEFIDDGTSWFAVDCYGQLASNVSMSLQQGMTVMVQGNLKIREWATEEKSGRTPTVVAEHVGPDLRFGTANFQKSSGGNRAQSQPSQQPQAHSAWGALSDPPTGRPGVDSSSPSFTSAREDDEGISSSGAEPAETAETGVEPAETFPSMMARDEPSRTEDGQPQAADGQSRTGDELTAEGDGEEVDRDAEDEAIARTTAAAAAPF